MEVEKFQYDNKTVKLFIIATVIFGIVGMLVGIIVAIQLFLPDLNMAPLLTFGRLRPLHTNAIIFAFVGNAMFAGVYYSLQRLLKTRMFSDMLSKIHFWGWQLIIVAAAITLPLGLTTSKEYAELEWPIDIAIALIWVVFGINMIGTILRRRERHMYVAVWFYIATFLTVALLHIFNSLALPVSGMKSYSVYAGVQDALVQWWYGHNAVAFFLTTPFLGLMYYYLPKAANRPVFSYKLSIIHFWSLVFIYIWAGPHHLLYSTLPDWAQSLGTVFSIMLIAPSWGGMLNGLLTLRGAWDRVREDPVLKFLVVAVTAYGMSTFEGPMMSLKNVNAIAHFTDWVIAHVHVGGLGWNGFMIFGVLYWMVPKMWGTKLYSTKLANIHFWVGTLGIIFYVLPMYVAGFTQGLMWKQFEPDGMLTYTNFLQTVTQIVPMYALRALGGVLYLVGALIMTYNLVKTAYQGKFIANEDAEAVPIQKQGPVHDTGWHSVLERKAVLFSTLTLFAVIVGGAVQIIPTIMVEENVPKIAAVKPYTPLELEGRDIYIREGCNTCHSQLIRPFRSETERYGEYSKVGEFVYDHPFLWGSKRTGPDLARVGAGKLKKPDSWHYEHMLNPRLTSPGSIMPAYPHLLSSDLSRSLTVAKLKAMRSLGVPYAEEYNDKDEVNEMMDEQAKLITTSIKESLKGKPNIQAHLKTLSKDKEIVALIAYLQKLGKDIEQGKEEDDVEVSLK